MKKIEIFFSGYGHFKISTTFRGKEYSAITTNTQAIDRYKNTDVSELTHADGGFTLKQAAQALYNEIKRANDLG